MKMHSHGQKEKKYYMIMLILLFLVGFIFGLILSGSSDQDQIKNETYQEIMGVKHHFDDREELKNALLLK